MALPGSIGTLMAHKALKAHTFPRLSGPLWRIGRLRRTLSPSRKRLYFSFISICARRKA
jgi:hypothetical protein